MRPLFRRRLPATAEEPQSPKGRTPMTYTATDVDAAHLAIWQREQNEAADAQGVGFGVWMQRILAANDLAEERDEPRVIPPFAKALAEQYRRPNKALLGTVAETQLSKAVAEQYRRHEAWRRVQARLIDEELLRIDAEPFQP